MGDVMVVDREGPGVCGMVVDLRVTGQMEVTWQEGLWRWETRRGCGSRAGSLVVVA